MSAISREEIERIVEEVELREGSPVRDLDHVPISAKLSAMKWADEACERVAALVEERMENNDRCEECHCELTDRGYENGGKTCLLCDSREEIARLRSDLEAAREAIKRVQMDGDGWIELRGCDSFYEWLNLPAVRAAVEGER